MTIRIVNRRTGQSLEQWATLVRDAQSEFIALMDGTVEPVPFPFNRWYWEPVDA